MIAIDPGIQVGYKGPRAGIAQLIPHSISVYCSETVGNTDSKRRRTQIRFLGGFDHGGPEVRFNRLYISPLGDPLKLRFGCRHHHHVGDPVRRIASQSTGVFPGIEIAEEGRL